MDNLSDLSIIIITKNEEKDIEKCLKSVSFANEIIILDSGSTDNTVNICKKYTAKIHDTDWPGFGIQKNRALDLTTKSWVLSLDADEWLTDNLKAEIKQIIELNKNIAYFIPRSSIYCGKEIKHGHWGNDRVLRLFKKNQAKFTNDIVHEKLISNVPTQLLKNKIMHNSFKDHFDVLTTMNNYSDLNAKKYIESGKKSSITKAITHGLFAFIKSYFLKLGFLDGKMGFALAVSFAEGSYYKYLKAYSMQN